MPDNLNRHPVAWRSVFAVAGVSLSSSIALGMTLCSLSTILVYVSTELQLSVTDSSRLTAGFFLAMTVAMPLAGWACRFLHPARWMALGTVLTGASYAAAARADSMAALFAALLVCGIGVAAASYIPATLLIARWVSHRRGLAFASLLSANALGATAFPPLANHFCAQLGWRSAVMVFGGAMIVIGTPVLMAVKRLGLPDPPPPEADEISPLDQSVRRSAVVGLTLLQMLAGLSYTSVYFFIVPYLLEAGYPTPFAAAVFGSLGLVSVGGFFLNGLLADRFGAQSVLFGGLLVCAASTLLLLRVPSSAATVAIVVFVLGWGATFNISSQLAPMLLIERVGMQRFGEVFGLTNFFTGVASALGPLITGFAHDRLHGYTAAFVLSAFVMALSALPLVFQSRATGQSLAGT
jgi:predicted MFS family arabinose efflux permease